MQTLVKILTNSHKERRCKVGTIESSEMIAAREAATIRALDKKIEKLATKNGKMRMQKKVFEWAVRWKMYMPQNMIDDLISTIEGEVNNDAN